MPQRLLVENQFMRAVKEAMEVAEKTDVDIANKEGRHIGPVIKSAI